VKASASYRRQSFQTSPAHVTAIDRTNHHLFQLLLYHVATSELTPGQIGSRIRNMLLRRADFGDYLRD
jgi:NADH dehydrogenase